MKYFLTTLAALLFGALPALAADTIPAMVNAPTPNAALRNVAVTMSAAYTDTAPPGDTAGVTSCNLLVDGTDQGAMTLSASSTNGTASKSFVFTNVTSYMVNAKCSDQGGNVTTSATTTVMVTADAGSPAVNAIQPSNANLGSAVNIQATISDNVAVTACTLEVNGSNQGAMTLASGTATKSFTFTILGDNAVKVTCQDAEGNVGLRSVLINVGVASDTSSPVVSAVNPTVTTAGVLTNVSATYSDNVGVASCSLYVNGGLVGSMSRSGTTSGTASLNHTFSGSGMQTMEVRCSDAAGNTGNAAASINVGASVSGPYTGRLVKLICPAGFIDVNHPCKAVYYVGTDGRRHAFPNERVFFTWYSNFDAVLSVDSNIMASFALGSNVTYRPGVKMVKFTTVNAVYAVARGGLLRWIKTETLARDYYGTSWNTRVDDISDAFYTNYRFGADINNTSDYNPSAEMNAATSIDQNY